MDRFDIVDPRFRAMVLPNAPLLTLGEDYAWLEGPVWFADRDCLLVSDLPNDRILRWSEGGGVSVFRQPSGFANGHARDQQGRLIGCSHRHRHIERTELDGTISVLASHYEGKRLNAPNDIVCKSDGTIWFSDPIYGISTDYEGGKQVPELRPRVYRLDPRDGTLRIVADDFTGPNGLAFSPDERWLYIAETGDQFDDAAPRHIRRFAVDDDGRLSGGEVFQRLARLCRRLPRRRGRQYLGRCGGRRALHRSRGRSARQDPDRRHGRKPLLRRPPSLAPVPVRLPRADGDRRQRPRRGQAVTVPRFERIVALRLVTRDPDRLARFYAGALGAELSERSPIAADECRLLGVSGGVRHGLRLGGFTIDLDRFEEAGRPYPADADAADLRFQHFAVVVRDIAAIFEQAIAAGAKPISRDGPVTLPASSGGITAVKLRDPEGHPFELLAFPAGAENRWRDVEANAAGVLGIDHSAIVVADAARSRAFYADASLEERGATVNRGPTQEALDGLNLDSVDVVPLHPRIDTLHLELLGYHGARPHRDAPMDVADIAATRTVWLANHDALVRDPDGHWLQMLAEPASWP